MTLDIGPARASDERAVVALWQACGLTVPYNDPATDFRFACGGANSDVLVARVEGGRVCASAMVGHDGHRGWIYYVAVDPTLQRQGVGVEIVSAAETWLKARDVPKVQLLVRETNTAVVAFYERLGFEVAPRVVMSKWIDGRE
ncbi:GNAT family acetyltransferase [Ancylobacter dichloromethanicus]|uniref:GNAT family acetyltransferase n=1 Tax=Ancylobacter dichloromethanicus TaxID=518825 RepID=A0A9W6JAQ7_9HYPH|nr:GNAT family acetyltransferase [Ancylobacter dichloromethanicus]MBS7552348.1 GNAT family acetyltransferase [Ancylobacter dichloromethanicus]GLK74085.1 GNAT family acetyltransferase [Ancylobacter dichloromethanicus]